MKTILFAVGMCVRLVNSDPWVEPTYKIQVVGKHSYYVQSAIKRGPGYQPHTTTGIEYDYIRYSLQDSLEQVECPVYNWDK